MPERDRLEQGQTWRQAAARIIHQQFTSIRQTQPNLPDKAIITMISVHYYPWHPRSGHPYAAWLKAIRDYKERLGIVTATGAKRDMPLFENSSTDPKR